MAAATNTILLEEGSVGVKQATEKIELSLNLIEVKILEISAELLEISALPPSPAIMDFSHRLDDHPAVKPAR